MKNENGEGSGITYVIMPVEILQDTNLTPSEKILYCYLSLFKKGVCFQSNEKLSEMTGFDESTIKRGLKKLSDMKYVFIEFVNNNSAMRRIYIVLDNPKKLAYLSKKGMFDIKKEESAKKIEKEPGSVSSRPRRADFESEEEYVEAFYSYNNM